MTPTRTDAASTPPDDAHLARLADLEALQPDDLLDVGRFLRRAASPDQPAALAAALAALAGHDPGSALLAEFDPTWADYDTAWRALQATRERGEVLDPDAVASLILLREDLECLRGLAARLLLAARERPTPSLESAWHRLTSAASVADAAAELQLEVLQDALDAAPSLAPALVDAFHVSPGDWWLALADPLLFEARHEAQPRRPVRLAAAGGEPGPVQKLQFEGVEHQLLVKRDRAGALWAVALFPVEGALRWSWVDSAGAVHEEPFAPDPTSPRSLCCRVDPVLLEERLAYSGLREGDRTWLFKGPARA